MPSNKKKQSSTLPLISPLAKETVKQELRKIVGALFKSSKLSGSESFIIKTPALSALHDEEPFMQIINMSATVLSYYVTNCLMFT